MSSLRERERGTTGAATLRAAPEVRYIDYSPARLTETLALMNRVHGRLTSAAEFEWWFERAPCTARNICLAEMDGRIVGCLSLTPCAMTFNGHDEIVGFGQRLCVDEACRGRGVFLSMQRHLEQVAAQRGIRLFLGFPNAKAHDIWTRKWDVLDLPRKRLYARLERPAPVLERLGAPSPVALCLDMLYRAASRLRRRSTTGATVLRPIVRCGADIDELWGRVSARLSDGVGCITRNAAYLNWRYCDGPGSSFRIIGAYENQTLVGYVITSSVEKEGVRVGVVADILALPKRHVLAVLLDRALAELRNSGVAVTVALEPPDALGRTVFVSRLLLPTPRRVPVIAKALDGDIERIRELRGARRLHFTLGDLDFI